MFEESALFKNAKHTDEKETEILNKAYKKGFSKKPTKLDGGDSDPYAGLSKGEILRKMRETK